MAIIGSTEGNAVDAVRRWPQRWLSVQELAREIGSVAKPAGSGRWT